MSRRLAVRMLSHSKLQSSRASLGTADMSSETHRAGLGMDLPSYPPWAVLAAAVLIACLYLHNLTVPFDFQADGALVYALVGADPIEWFIRVWQLVMADSSLRGPFRPTFWFVQQAAATVFGPTPLPWRVFYFGWSIVAALTTLLLMRELRICLFAASCVTALAMWNSQRGTIWTHFG